MSSFSYNIKHSRLQSELKNLHKIGSFSTGKSSTLEDGITEPKDRLVTLKK
jgi:hypothetical protein